MNNCFRPVGKRCLKQPARGGPVGPGEQLVQAAVGMSFDDAGDNVGEVGLGVAVQETRAAGIAFRGYVRDGAVKALRGLFQQYRRVSGGGSEP